MKTLGPDTSATAERAVHRARNADGETADSAGERPPRVRLGDEMNVIVLDAELNDPEIRARGNGQSAVHVREHTGGTQAANGFHSAQRDVDGLSGDVRRARSMRNAPSAPRRDLAPGTGAFTAPLRRRRQDELNRTTSQTTLIERY